MWNTRCIYFKRFPRVVNHCELLLLAFVVSPTVRDRRRLQNRRIFGKVPNGLWLPPSFSENHIADFATKLRQKCVCSLWRDCCVLYDPISHEMHVVQQFNVVIGWKHTQKRPVCNIFMLKKPYLKVKILQYKFLDWTWPLPALFQNFSENSSVLVGLSVPSSEKVCNF